MFETLTDRLTGTFSFLRGRKELTEENLDEGLREVRQALLEADVHFGIARDFTKRVGERVTGDDRLKGVEPSQQFVHAFHQELVELMGPEDATLTFAKHGPTVILMAGLQGAGKTTTCAKLARFLRDRHTKRPLLVAADIKRPAAVEQLKVLGRQLDLPVFHEEGLAPPEVCKRGVEYARQHGHDVVLLDTAGRLHIDDGLMAEVAEIAKVTKPDNQVLVVDAMTGQDAVNSAKSFHERLELTGCILTKMDGDARGGAAMSLKEVTGVPILYVGTGEKIDDLDAFSPERMAGRILGMGDVVGLVERTQEKIDEHEAQASMEKMVLGTFTFEDMLGMFQMIASLGPMKDVLGMMPGMKDLKNADIDDNVLVQKKALIQSMTARERIRPDVLDMSRRRRIARGAGQPVAAVNELIKSHGMMKKAMKQLNKMGLGSMLGSSKAKKETLRGMSPTGELAAGGGGLMGGLGALGSGLGAGMKGLGNKLMGGGGLPAGMEGLDPSQMMGGVGRPMGTSPTKKSGSKRKQKDRKKRKGRK